MKNKLEGEECPVCGKETLTLKEELKKVDELGKVFLLSMDCDSCGLENHDVEAETPQPAEYTIKVEDTEDLDIKVVKSSRATIKIPYVTTVEPTETSEGYIADIREVLEEVKTYLKAEQAACDSKKEKKKLKNKKKKISDVLVGREDVKVKIKDPTGSSAIISDQAEKKEL